jgi:hypothetical protein
MNINNVTDMVLYTHMKKIDIKIVFKATKVVRDKEMGEFKVSRHKVSLIDSTDTSKMKQSQIKRYKKIRRILKSIPSNICRGPAIQASIINLYKSYPEMFRLKVATYDTDVLTTIRVQNDLGI